MEQKTGKRKWCLGQQSGNVGELMLTGICILAMTMVMLAYMDSVELLEQKSQIGLLARRYLLRMETMGYLCPEDMNELTLELKELGVTEIHYGGTTTQQATYGADVILQIQGVLEGEYEFVEKRVSTAKY